ncbi:MAG: hypothetical protein LC624_10660 [Halobacteriales archaeon]|nr:hypothetical protein [Halobacteriales archaeon]
MNTKILLAGLLLSATALVGVAGLGSATMTCTPDPAQTVCFGDSGDDPYAFCDGQWVDGFDGYVTGTEAQVCAGYAGDNHVIVCSLVNGCTDLLG